MESGGRLSRRPSVAGGLSAAAPRQTPQSRGQSVVRAALFDAARGGIQRRDGGFGKRPTRRSPGGERRRLDPKVKSWPLPEQGLCDRFEFGSPIAQPHAPGRRVGKNRKFVSMEAYANDMNSFLPAECGGKPVADAGEAARLSGETPRQRRQGES